AKSGNPLRRSPFVQPIRLVGSTLPHRREEAPMATMAATVRDGILERRFRFAEHGTTLARDTMAGVTTFIVMSYIIFLNPTILSFAGVKGLEAKGLPFDGVLTVTCVVAGVMT